MTPKPDCQFLRLFTLALLGAGTLASPLLGAAAPKARILETRVISHEPEYYHGWATVASRKSGDLVLVYSGGRDWHVCPFGRVDFMVSHDEGKSWSWRRTILDTDIDDRDAGIVETAKGSLIATTFTAISYERYLDAVAAGKPLTYTESDGRKAEVIESGRLEAWKAAHNRLSAAERKALVGTWTMRSTDGGISWAPPARCPVNSPHGPILLQDGRLLYLGKQFDGSAEPIGACESRDDGQTWQWIATLPTRPGDNAREYHELHAVEAANGTLVCHIRNHNPTNNRETLQTESTDGGKTWTVPHAIGVWGLPSHLLRLRDGRLVMTYGHRRAPFGNQARISSDHGQTWSAPLMLSPDSTNGDLGYPATVELKDGTLLSVWYEAVPGIKRAALRQAHWKLE